MEPRHNRTRENKERKKQNFFDFFFIAGIILVLIYINPDIFMKFLPFSDVKREVLVEKHMKAKAELHVKVDDFFNKP